MMVNILAFSGSPRKKGNTSLLLKELIRGARENSAKIEEIDAHKINLMYCKGCLRCNLIKRCAIKDDDWKDITSKLLNADVIIFASPVYFHHLSAPLKKVLDRFRSLINVTITEDGLKYTPWHEWRKKFVLLLCSGSSDDADAQPVIDLFKYITSMLGPDNKLHCLTGTRLAVVNQVTMSEEELSSLYSKLNLPLHLATQDSQRNQLLLKRCYQLGKELGKD
ncbi:MAG: flavodoxin family protein [Deltaproteobacteria bacterium]|nr:flavodoxin family protein [Deltaproteobacteria bacterium]